MLSSGNKSSPNKFRQKQRLMAFDGNPNHKYIQQCPECHGIHETQRQNDEFCVQCKANKMTA